MSRKRPFVAVLVISAIALFSGLPPAYASLEESEEIYYFNYGSQYPDGSEGYNCASYFWSEGDQTPHNGELKAVVVTNCDTWQTEVTWYRYSDPGCSTPHWHWIPEPYWSNYVIC